MGARATQPTIIPPRAMHKTGTYVGNAVDNRNIDIGVDLAAKSNVYIIIQQTTTRGAQHKIEVGQGDLTQMFHTTGDWPDRIQAFTATGFQLGTSAEVNSDGDNFRYVVFWEEP